MKEYNIYRMIDLYFDAQLSLTEEKELLERLLSFEGKDPMVEEALAVMLMAINPLVKPGRTVRPKTKIRVWNIAAAVALLVAAGITAVWHSSHNDSGRTMEGMVAYVGGVKVSDHAEIMKIVDNQLNDIGEYSDFFAQEVSSDLDDIRQALMSEEI